MKPIKLKIKGVNSFIEEQIIDFEKLTERGLFGIFGPTGSGKSTILDGITLALYGEVSRKSSNYINTNCKSLNVSFEFQISGLEVKRYIVDREFKRDPKTGNPRAGATKIVDITKGNIEVLADKSKAVTEKCIEIIGLSLDDFTRTVVLPQGKFSEFLKLEGKGRSEMLERLFNLQKYGDNLSIKLSRAITKEKTESSVLIGELKGYEDISTEKLNEKQLQFNLVNSNLDKSIDELKIIEKEFTRNKELWKLQLELETYKKEEEGLKAKSESIERSKHKLKLSEAALKIHPSILSYDNILKEIERVEGQVTRLKDDLNRIKKEREDVEKKWLLLREQKDKEVPELKIKEQKLIDAIEEQKLLKIEEEEIRVSKDRVVHLRGEYCKGKEDIKLAGEKLAFINSTIKDCEEKFDSLKVDDRLKSNVQEGIVVSERYNSLCGALNKNRLKRDAMNSEVDEAKKDKELIKKSSDEKHEALKEATVSLEDIIKNSPGEAVDLLNLQRRLTNSKESWSNFNKYSKELEEGNRTIEELKIFMDGKKLEKLSIENTVKDLKHRCKDLEMENLAYKLRENLQFGEVCPVCGSMEHKKENIKVIEDKNLSEVEEKCNLNEDLLKCIDADITKAETKIAFEEEKVLKLQEEIRELGEDFKAVSLEKLEDSFNALQNSIKEYSAKKEALENIIDILTKENYKLENKFNNKNIFIEENEKQLKVFNEEELSCYEDVQHTEKELNRLKEDTGVCDFRVKSKEILEVENKREKLSIAIKTNRAEIESLESQRETMKSNLNEINDRGTYEKASLHKMEKSREEKVNRIKAKLYGDLDMISEVYNNENLHYEDSLKSRINLDSESNLISNIDNESNFISKLDLLSSMNKIIAKINSVEVIFTKTEFIKNNIEKSYTDCSEKLMEIMGRQDELHKRSILEERRLETILKEENFESIEEVNKNITSKEEINLLKEEIEKYNHTVSKVAGAVESLLKKIDNRVLTEEKWLSIEVLKSEKENEIKLLNEGKIKLQEEVNYITGKLEELKDLLDRKDKLDHKLSLLDDLEKLFKGKSFVQFVATTQLKYVSLEASKRLKEITGGSYGLEVDDNVKFIIRDYKNGGAKRDASTLSGGETFLASLALALALSTQIQLKGTAPLELFFLDEGFGTLDDDLLEVVMSSLEKIHNNKLKVGIISHVESIKNRVPVKLIVTKAESGKGGSKVKIERS